MQAGVKVLDNVGTTYELGRLRLNGDMSPERKELHRCSWAALDIWLRWSLYLLKARKCLLVHLSARLEMTQSWRSGYDMVGGASHSHDLHMFITVN